MLPKIVLFNLLVKFALLTVHHWHIVELLAFICAIKFYIFNRKMLGQVA